MTEPKERRKHPRLTCDAGVRVHPQEGGRDYWGTLSDVSLGGCYISTFSPLPAGQAITLTIEISGVEVGIVAKTVSFHPGVGMGVAFTGFLQSHGEARLKTFLSQLSTQSNTKDSVSVFY